MNLTVLYEPWRLRPLAWIHRVEARSIVAELERAGHTVNLIPFRENRIASLPPGPLLLRVSDPVMLLATRALTRAARPFWGPAAAVMERCHDKYDALRLAVAHGVACPATALAGEAGAMPFPLVLKPRRGSDSIGVKVVREGPIPPRLQTEMHVAQEQVRGTELTIGVIRERTGLPLRILLPEGTPYSFVRKYLYRPRREVLTDDALGGRVRDTALQIARLFGVNWAARIDFIYDPRRGRLCFLECDAAPLVGPASAFAVSLAAAGMTRAEQLRSLIDDAGCTKPSLVNRDRISLLDPGSPFSWRLTRHAARGGCRRAAR
ncbi:MAG: ATP-grasp domain-containing protein [Betaproteobacteria bacterium]|nr:ATP-grasp domain-containing protein [Betaproteobacteria bacterium]MDH3437819.1 ATP-grasp domain-containing protein [Betaproteobacteria bacterium]